MNEVLSVPASEVSTAPESRPPAAPVKIAVLLVNLGTPEGTDAAAVRVYLKEFLYDPRVIEDQGWRWKLVLNGIILRVRPRRKGRDYAKIWNRERNESPLKTITRSQAEKLGCTLEPLGGRRQPRRDREQGNEGGGEETDEGHESSARNFDVMGA